MKIALPLVRDEAITTPTSLMVTSLCNQIKEIISRVKAFECEINSICSKHTDYQILASLPGAAEVSASRMIAAFGTRRERFSNANEAARYFGIAPVLERSGNQEWIRWRYFCPTLIRQSFHEFANQPTKFSFWAGEYCKAQRAKGKTHHVAIRAVAHKWLRILFTCWKDGKFYNESIYLKALAKKSSTLISQGAIIGTLF